MGLLAPDGPTTANTLRIPVEKKHSRHEQCPCGCFMRSLTIACSPWPRPCSRAGGDGVVRLEFSTPRAKASGSKAPGNHRAGGSLIFLRGLLKSAERPLFSSPAHQAE